MTEQIDQVDSDNIDERYTREDEDIGCQTVPPPPEPPTVIEGNKVVSVSVVVERPNGTKQMRELVYPDSHYWAGELYKRLSEYVDPDLFPFPIFNWNIKEGI